MGHEELKKLSSQIQQIEVLEQENPFFPTYKFFKRKLKTINSIEKLKHKLDSWSTLLGVHLISIKNAKVLAVGCGSGLECVYFRFLGAKEVCGLDVNPMFTTGMHRLFRQLELEETVRPLLMDIHNYNNSDLYDVIITVDAVSHMYDYQLFLKQCYRLLNPSGRLLIVDDNNKLNLMRRKEVFEIWESWEKKGATYEDQQGVERRINSYEEDRFEFIHHEYPELTIETCKSLAQHTSGLRQIEIRKAVEAYRMNHRMPGHIYKRGEMAYDSRLDMPKEIQFNPYMLANIMQKSGYRRVVHAPGLIRATSVSRRLLLYMILFMKFFAYISYSKGFSISGSK